MDNLSNKNSDILLVNEKEAIHFSEKQNSEQAARQFYFLKRSI